MGDFTGCNHKVTGDGDGALGGCAWAATWLPLLAQVGTGHRAGRRLKVCVRGGVEGCREFAGSLFAAHAVHQEGDRACVGVPCDLAVVDQARDRGPGCIVHGVVGGVAVAGGERGLPVRGVEGGGAGGARDEVRGRGIGSCCVAGIVTKPCRSRLCWRGGLPGPPCDRTGPAVCPHGRTLTVTTASA
ncbi:hypothetical protein [Streptomyces sp. NPDC003996]